MSHLMEELSCFIRRQSAPWNNKIEQLSSLHVLHDNEDVGGRIDNFVPVNELFVQLIVSGVFDFCKIGTR